MCCCDVVCGESGLPQEITTSGQNAFLIQAPLCAKSQLWREAAAFVERYRKGSRAAGKWPGIWGDGGGENRTGALIGAVGGVSASRAWGSFSLLHAMPASRGT